MVSHCWECVVLKLFFLSRGQSMFQTEFCRIFGKILKCRFIFKIQFNLIRSVDYRYSNGLGYLVPCESLDGFRETGTHSRARGDCHVSTFPGRGVTQTMDSIRNYGLKTGSESPHLVMIPKLAINLSNQVSVPIIA